MTSDVLSANVRETGAKEAQSIPTATPETENPILSPGAESFSPSPISITSRKIATPAIYEPGASDVTSPMTQNTMPELESAALVLSGTIASPLCLNGKKRNKSAERSHELRRVLRQDATQVPLYQIQLEHWKPFNDRVKAGLEIWGSSAKCEGGEYAVRAKQIAAACQMNGLNDPYATPEKRLAAATALWKGKETFDRAFEQKSDKAEWKDQFKKTVANVAEFFGLGNKKAVKARGKKK